MCKFWIICHTHMSAVQTCVLYAQHTRAHAHIQGINHFTGVFTYTPTIKVNVCLTTDSSGRRLGEMWQRPKRMNPGPDTQTVTDVGFYHPYRCCSFMVLHSLAPPRLSEISWGSLWMFADAKDYCKEHQPPNTPVEPWVWRDDLLDLRRGAVSFCSRCPVGIFEVPSPLRCH